MACIELLWASAKIKLFSYYNKVKLMGENKAEKINNLDILSSIWILACNDENPQITYKGIIYRIGLDDEFDIQGLVESRAELFRKHTTTKQLNAWRKAMLVDERLPSWIRDIDDADKRTKAIKDLKIEDVFRSQFRAEADSPRSSIDVINWGLQHIDRLRKADLEAKQESTRVFSSVWHPLLSTFVAVIAVLSSFYVQYTSNSNQVYLKHFEVELRPKQVGYSDFMKAMTQTYYMALHNDRFQMVQCLDKIESSFYSFEPFLNDSNRAEIWSQYQNYGEFCYNVIKSDSLRMPDKSMDSFITFRSYFRQNLYNALFLTEKMERTTNK